MSKNEDSMPKSGSDIWPDRTKTALITDNLLYGLAVLAMAALMLHTVSNAVIRTATGIPLTDTVEYVSGWHMPVAILTGLLIAYRTDEHTRAGLIFQQLNDRVKRIVEIISTLIQLAFVSVVTVVSVPEAMDSYRINEHYGISSVVIWPVKWLVPIVFALMVLVLIKGLLEHLRSDPLPQPSGDGPERTSTKEMNR